MRGRIRMKFTLEEPKDVFERFDADNDGFLNLNDLDKLSGTVKASFKIEASDAYHKFLRL